MRKAFWIGVFLWAVGAAPASAQIGIPGLALSGGLAIPVAPSGFTDLHNVGFALAGGVKYRPVPLFSLNLEIGYCRMPFDGGAFVKSIAARFPNVSVNGNDANIIPATLAVELPFLPNASTKPYLSFGGGFYHIGTGSVQISGPNANQVQVPHQSDNVFGLRFGIGVRSPVTPLASVFLDASYHIAFTNPDHIQFVPLRFGMRF